ncbi:Disease resistance protein [Quillaja saponaria]|uniref:Disease resistance protein n=1 Tax=Quillaja saponaria TaxID=32244 RepID=A0AAD7VDR6_QUISA|nr:Disease resistance protein [Quillaja saponaria]
MRKTHVLKLINVNNLKNNVHELDGEGFPFLQDLMIHDCDDLEHLVDGGETMDLQVFGSLKSLVVYDCKVLKSLFPSSVDFDIIGFSNLVELELRRLPSLIGFVDAIDEDESCQPFTKATLMRDDAPSVIELEAMEEKWPTMLNLEKLDVEGLYSLDTILQAEENRGDYKFALNCFVKLELWRSQEVVGFHNLRLLRVES